MATGGGMIPVRMAFSSEAELQRSVKERTRMKKQLVCRYPRHNGTRPTNTVDAPIEGRVLDINEEPAASQSILVRLQESTGFAKDVLPRVEEDVWNGI